MRNPIKKQDMGINFIKEAPSKRIPSNDPHRKNGRLIRMVTLYCLNCNKQFDVPLSTAKRTKQKCCSQSCYKRLVEIFEGGNERHPLYSRWLSMTQRCNNPTNCNYKNYGKRGITIEKYLTNFVNYANYVSSLSNYDIKALDTLTIDRIDNDRGYFRGNLRWATRSIQTINQRKQINNSGYTGICWSKIHEKWVVNLTFNAKRYCSSTHKLLRDAVKARNLCIIQNHLPHKLQFFKQN